MAIQRHWKGRPRGLAELPREIREAERYQGKDWWIDRIRMSVDGCWYKLEFEDGLCDYWRLALDQMLWAYTTELPPWEKADNDSVVIIDPPDLGGEG